MIDDIIRREKRILNKKGKKLQDYVFRWGKNEFNSISDFLSFAGFSGVVKNHQGVSYMGMKHFKGRKNSGYKITKMK